MTLPTDKLFCAYHNQGLFIDATPGGQKRIAMCCWQKRINVDKVEFDHPSLINIRKRAENDLPGECTPYCKIENHINNERQHSLK